MKLLRELGSAADTEEVGRASAHRPRRVGSAAGVEVDTQGDAFFFAFANTPSTIAAASGARRPVYTVTTLDLTVAARGATAQKTPNCLIKQRAMSSPGQHQSEIWRPV